MALLTTIAIIAGITTVVIGTAATAGVYFATEEERIRAEIDGLKEINKQCNTIINFYDDLRTKLNNGKDYLKESRKGFLNGGHVLNGEPLANAEFWSCTDKITSAVESINNIISDLEATVAENKRKIKELEAEL